jgi:hypothetical protein
MEISNNTKAQNLNENVYPEVINETKSIVNPQSLLWALIAVVLFVIYRQQPDKDTTLGIIQITLALVCAVLAIIKFFSNGHKLTYTPTNSPVEKTEKYYNLNLEGDIRQCMKEGNTSRLNALKTDDAGGILVETIESKDKVFMAVRMQKYCPEGYRPETEWVVM